jgi:hypothetical protein
MSQALDPVTQHHVRQAAERLADEFAGVFSEETIERYISESLDLLGEPASTSSSLSSHTASHASACARFPRQKGGS